MKKLFFTFFATLLPMLANAYDAMVGGIYYNLNTSDNTASVTYKYAVEHDGFEYYSDYSGNLKIPSSFTYSSVTYTVTSIGEYAFCRSNNLTSVEIPNSVTSIKRGAFRYCSSLTTLTIPNSVTYVYEWCLDDTPWYNNQPDGLVYVGKVAYKFKGTMPDNTAITIKDGTVGITDYAFENCSGLSSVVIPDGITYIGYYAFSGCI